MYKYIAVNIILTPTNCKEKRKQFFGGLFLLERITVIVHENIQYVQRNNLSEYRVCECCCRFENKSHRPGCEKTVTK